MLWNRLTEREFHPDIPNWVTVDPNPVKTWLSSLWYGDNNSYFTNLQEELEESKKKKMDVEINALQIVKQLFMGGIILHAHYWGGKTPFGFIYQRKSSLTSLQEEKIYWPQ